MSVLTDRLEQYSYEYLMQRALSSVSDENDKRQGSVIYTALAPACYELANAFLEMRYLLDETYVMTATGENLDNRVIEQGIIRLEATKAIRKGVFTDTDGNPYELALGTRFSSMGDITYTYVVTGSIPNEPINVYYLECEQPGNGGNTYSGDLIPITHIPPLGSAKISTIIIPGEDTETDQQLRKRYIDEVNGAGFAGNIYAYDKLLNERDGIGEAQIYPVWNGGGTVLLSVVDADYNPITIEFIAILEKEIDPENVIGEKGSGLGQAPIGHKVTVKTPSLYMINITATVALKNGYLLPQVQTDIEKEIKAYIDEVRALWGVSDEYNNYGIAIYTAQIAAAILRAPGVDNVTNVMTNGSITDKILTQSAALQQIPKLGTVIINGS